MTTHTPGQIALYGTQEFNDNRAVRTTLASGLTNSPHGIRRPVTLYHQTDGYWPAGSCATWRKGVYGVTIYDANSNTTYGQQFADLDDAKAYFIRMTKGE